MVCLAWYLGKYCRKEDIFVPRIDFSLILETLLSRSIDWIIKKQSTNDRGSPPDRKWRENSLEGRVPGPGWWPAYCSAGEEDNYLNDFLCRRTQAGLAVLTLSSWYRGVTTTRSGNCSFGRCCPGYSYWHLNFPPNRNSSLYTWATRVAIHATIRLEKLSSVLDDRVVRLVLTISRNQIYN